MNDQKYEEAVKLLANLDQESLKQLADSNILWLSQLARNRIKR